MTIKSNRKPSLRMIMWRGVLVVSVLLVAGLLRLTALERYPIPVNHDELSNIYDGWSIAQTGADRSGRRWPILCYGFGPSDNRPALFAWLCAGVSWWTGFSVWGCRAISGVVGTATVALVGLWGLRVLGCRGAMLAMVLLAVSPWHVAYSRLSLEGTAVPGLFCVAIILLVRRAAFSGMTPPEFQQADRRVWGRYIEFCTQLNRYHFITRQEALQQWQASAQNKRWLLLDVARTFGYELGGPSSLTPER